MSFSQQEKKGGPSAVLEAIKPSPRKEGAEEKQRSARRPRNLHSVATQEDPCLLLEPEEEEGPVFGRPKSQQVRI